MYENTVLERVFIPQKVETIRAWKKDLAQNVVLWQAFVNLVMNI
jgi:hypothetical protein